MIAVSGAITGVLDLIGGVAAGIAPGISAIYPSIAFQEAFGIWFGPWGVIGTYIGTLISKLIQGMPAPIAPVFNIANAINALVPYLAWRAFKLNPALRGKKEWIALVPFFFIIPNFIANVVAIPILIWFLGVPASSYWPIFVSAYSADLLSLLVLGVPLLLLVSPVIKRTRFWVRGWK